MQDLAIWKAYALSASEIASLACSFPIQRSAIVSYWKMDEASGNGVDSIGGYTATETSGTIESTTGKVGNARDFEAGDTEYFTVTNAIFDTPLHFTMLLWWKPESTPGSYMSLIAKDYDTDGYFVGHDGSDKFRFGITTAYSVSTTFLAAGVWAHGVGVFTGAGRHVYFNSVLEDTDASTTAPADTGSAFEIGRITSGSYADGVMDEVLFAKRYFRHEEVKMVYNRGLNGKEITSSELLESVAKIAGVSFANVGKVAGVAKGVIGKVSGAL